MKRKIKILNIIGIFTIFLVSAIFCYFINKNIEIRSMYMDDLSDFYYFMRQSFLEFSFGAIKGQHHYRPIFYSTLYIIYSLIKEHIWRIVLINTFFQALISTTIYLAARSMKVNKILSLFCSYMYLLSHFACFQMGQVIGCIESEAIFFSIILFAICIVYLRATSDKENNKYEALIFIIYFLLAMTHERYISNILMVLSAFIIKNIIIDKNRVNNFIKNMIIIIAELIFIFGIRFILIGYLIPTGTGRTNVVETFDTLRAISYVFSQVLYIFGINDGPEHLNGINFWDTLLSIRIEVYISIIISLSIYIYYLYIKIKNSKINSLRTFLQTFYYDIIAIVYMGGCIAASSITIRLEMRWVYSSFMIFIFYLTEVIMTIMSNEKIDVIFKKGLIALLFIFTILRTNTELYYRSYYYMIYFINDLHLTNNLADQTFYKYGKDGMEGKRVYILNNLYKLAGRCEWYFYEPFTGEIYNGDYPVINFIPDYDPNNPKYDIKNNKEFIDFINDRNNLVFAEDYANHAYIRVNPD